MTKYIIYIIYIIFGILLFILWNRLDRFSVGIPWKLDLEEQSGGATGREVPPQNIFDNRYLAYVAQLQNPLNYTARLPYAIDVGGAEIGDTPCISITEAEIQEACPPEPESCAAKPRGMAQGPTGCPQEPRLVGLTGLAGLAESNHSPSICHQFMSLDECINIDIMKRLFEIYKILGKLLIIHNKFQSGSLQISPTLQMMLIRTHRLPLDRVFENILSNILDDINENCQLYRYDDVLIILNDRLTTFFMDDDGNLIINKAEINKRCEITIYILLLLLDSNFHVEYIINIFEQCINAYIFNSEQVEVVRSGLQTEYINSNNILTYNILTSIYRGLSGIDIAIWQWMEGQDGRFDLFIIGNDGQTRYNIMAANVMFRYEDYISLFTYLANMYICSNIIKALQNPIFREFFGLP